MIDRFSLVQQFTGSGSSDHSLPLSRRLQAALDGNFSKDRDAARQFMSRPELAPVPDDLPKDQYRAVTLDRIKMMIDAGFSRMPYDIAQGGLGKIAESLNVSEMLAHADMSLAVKQGVQFGLFGTSIERLGTEKHQHLIPDIIAGKLLGGFAMTEMACGSDVQGTRTEAVYDHTSGTFIINTPTPDARKTYIGNAALHGRLMVVFAQLKMAPDVQSQGVHAFLVPIRDENGAALPGVTIGDNGHKIGLNGIDNGTLHFNHVTVPRDALLDRFGGVTEDGVYKSPVAKITARFFKMVGTLVTGRVFVSMAALSGAKNALTSIVNFSENRKVFGETLLDKQSAQTRLLPKLAEAYALHFATRDLLTAFTQGRPETETMAAAIKAYATDGSIETVDEARLLAGGAGYLSQERYGALRNDMDVFRTFEGDNTVLRLLVAKNQLGRLAGKFKDASLLGQFVKNLAMQRKDRLARWQADGARREDFLDPESQNLIFEGRERAMMHHLSRKIMKLSKSGGKEFAANACQDDMIAYADAYAERLMIERFTAAVEAQKDPQVKTVLKDVCDLFAVSCMRRNAAWYLENGHLSPETGRALRRLEHDLNAKIRPQAKILVQAFGIPEQLLSGYTPRTEPGPAPKPAP
jgi:acyl-CoA oxidase